MHFSQFLIIAIAVILQLFTSAPDNDDIRNAKELLSIDAYCSNDAEYNNTTATSSGYNKGFFWPSEGKDVWFRFTASKTDVVVTVGGKTGGASINTLLNPLVAIYTFNGVTISEMIGSMTSSNNTTTCYKGALLIGQEYYIRISAQNNSTGSFRLCVNNYLPATAPGQDYNTASFLCDKRTFTIFSVSGSGNNNRESAGTCLNGESNTAWYKWIAADSGSLTFNIVPSSDTDDIDWVLYDLGTSGSSTNVTAANSIRCAAGNGISCAPSYFITGLNLFATDLTEQKGCVSGQDGMLKYVDMIKGHTYALLIDNFSSNNNGFTLSFGGTGNFYVPPAEINIVKNNPCESSQTFTFFTQSENYSSMKWDFGAGANINQATSAGPHILRYSDFGEKIISLETRSILGCESVAYYRLLVAEKPDPPAISASSLQLCIGDVLKLTTTDQINADYLWTGPRNFSSAVQNPEINIVGPENAGTYKLIVKKGDCQSEAIITIPNIDEKPSAAFSTNLDLLSKYAAPITISFVNQSRNANSYLWDFGDQSSSSATNPIHTYSNEGTYAITLTAFSSNKCFNIVTKGDLTVLKNAEIFIPSAFSPNADGINDEFKVDIVNLKAYQLSVVNRWGITVFNTTSVINNWNGKHNNKDLPGGVYFYHIKAKSNNGLEINKSGTITLLR